MALTVTDAGLQAHRTSLAWTRTALGFAVNAILVLRTGLLEGDPVAIIAGTGIAMTAVLAAGIGIRRRRQLAETSAVAVTSISWVCAGAVVAACSGLVLVLR